IARKLFRIADHAALRSAERDVGDRALPRHPRRQRAHFIGVDFGVIANAALSGAANPRVQSAIARENFYSSVIAFYRELDFEEPERSAEPAAQTFRKIGDVAGRG